MNRLTKSHTIQKGSERDCNVSQIPQKPGKLQNITGNSVKLNDKNTSETERLLESCNYWVTEKRLHNLNSFNLGFVCLPIIYFQSLRKTNLVCVRPETHLYSVKGRLYFHDDGNVNVETMVNLCLMILYLMNGYVNQEVRKFKWIK